jgi:hypothetical protein
LNALFQGVLRALNRNVERVFNPDRKDPHWGRRTLKREECSAPCADVSLAAASRQA